MKQEMKGKTGKTHKEGRISMDQRLGTLSPFLFLKPPIVAKDSKEPESHTTTQGGINEASTHTLFSCQPC